MYESHFSIDGLENPWREQVHHVIRHLSSVLLRAQLLSEMYRRNSKYSESNKFNKFKQNDTQISRKSTRYFQTQKCSLVGDFDSPNRVKN